MKNLTSTKSISINIICKYRDTKFRNFLNHLIICLIALALSHSGLCQLRKYKRQLGTIDFTSDSGFVFFDYTSRLNGSTIMGDGTEGYSTTSIWYISKTNKEGNQEWKKSVTVPSHHLYDYVITPKGDLIYEIQAITDSPTFGKPHHDVQIRTLNLKGDFSDVVSVFPTDGRWKNILIFCNGTDINFFIQKENAKRINQIGEPIETLWVKIDKDLNKTTRVIHFPSYNSNKIVDISFTFLGTQNSKALFIASYRDYDLNNGKQVQTKLLSIAPNDKLEEQDLTEQLNVSRYSQSTNIKKRNKYVDPLFFQNMVVIKYHKPSKSLFYNVVNEDRVSCRVGSISLLGEQNWEINIPTQKRIGGKAIFDSEGIMIYGDTYLTWNMWMLFSGEGKMCLLDMKDGTMLAEENYEARNRRELPYLSGWVLANIQNSKAANFYQNLPAANSDSLPNQGRVFLYKRNTDSELIGVRYSDGLKGIIFPKF